MAPPPSFPTPVRQSTAESFGSPLSRSSTLGSADERENMLHNRSSMSKHDLPTSTNNIELQHYPQKRENTAEFIGDIEEGVERQFHHIGEVLERDVTGEMHATQKLWDRFRGKGRRRIGVVESFVNIAKSSSLNLLLVFIPFAWVSHFYWKHQKTTFALCFLSIVPLENLFDYGGEQMAFYTGKVLGDFIKVSLGNAVEAALAIILLVRKCELRLLQSTVVGVVLLHLLLVPGTAFLTGGARIWEQNLHQHTTELNHTLLVIGVLSMLIPAAFFAALDNVPTQTSLTNGPPLVSDASRGQFLMMSRGIAIVLLCVYIASRIFLHNPPGKGNSNKLDPNAPEEMHEEEKHLRRGDPEVNVYFCILFLLLTIAIMAVTAEMLVESVEHVQAASHITKEWLGLVLLPFASFSADGAVAVLYFIKAALFLEPEPPATLAKAQAIDLSIQFTLFWMPFLVLLGWFTNKPLTLLFDLYEVALALGACFLVNYVTADAKTNWVEGFMMVSFYVMIALCSWFYTGQESIEQMLDCTSVAHALAEASEGGGEAVESVARFLLRR